MPDINLRHFFALDDIATTGRISTAAARVFMSQSALTQALRKLEEIAGTHLFERAGFGVTETEAGQVLVSRARRAISLLQSAEREIRTRARTALACAPLHRHVTASQLRSLIAVSETGGYSLGARKLGLAQPTVHRAAKDLEAIVGIDLFVRAARGIETTEAARVLARFAELVFAEVRQGFESVHELRGLATSRVAIGALPLVRSEFLPVAVDRLLQRFPDARVRIQDGPYIELLHALRYGHIDWLIGALRDPLPIGDVVQERLFEQPLAIVVRPGHPLLNHGTPSPAALAELEWVVPRPLAPSRLIFDAYFQANGVVTPTRTIECGSLVSTRRLLRSSDRAAMLSPLQVREDIADGALAVLLESIPNSRRNIGVTTRADFEPTRVQAQFGAIIRQLAQHAE
ncbi:MAG: LysR family transcriptional regulator [Pseudomonadota bacterium]